MKNLKFEIQVDFEDRIGDNIKNDFYVHHFKKRIYHTVLNDVILGVGLRIMISLTK
jgi:hypothetical protein